MLVLVAIALSWCIDHRVPFYFKLRNILKWEMKLKYNIMSQEI